MAQAIILNTISNQRQDVGEKEPVMVGFSGKAL